ncbi:MAG: alpha-galactosidase [Fimbriimonadaceae bacterium]
MLLYALTCLASTHAGAPNERAWFPIAPGPAVARSGPTAQVLTNRVLQLTVANDGSSVQFENKLDRTELVLDGPQLVGGGFAIKFGRPLTTFSAGLGVDPKSSVASRHLHGFYIKLVNTSADRGYNLEWTWELRDGSNYVRESLRIDRQAGAPADGTASRIDLIGFDSADASVIGTVPGSPVVAGNVFAGVEYPMSASAVIDGHVRCSAGRKVPITAGHPVTYSAVIGVAPAGQMRRAFLRYVERERAHPYRPFLHYNSWYDLGYFTPYTSDQCVERINAFGQELSVKRGVKLSSFLFDDGWDDYAGVWKFSKAFPDAFQPLKAAAAKYGAGPGVWLSPWGGYGGPREKRLAAGKAAGYEVDSQGYALSGPKYFQRFKDVTLDFVKNQGINQFKFDGTGSPDKQYPGSAFDSDFAAAISLIGDLRAAEPDLFVNLTTGTWPSPFWLRFADSTWRGGADHSFAGVGPSREQWITYRDGDTYHGVVKRGPLYPINSLMLHGIIYAQNADRLSTDPTDDFRNDVRAYFATGTQLQEMYITPKLLTPKNWDDLAEAAKWARANAAALVDTHWIGGDPTKLEVYGHAAWMGSTGIIELRNPAAKAQAYAVDIARALQLPASVKGVFHGHSPWAADSKQPAEDFAVGSSRVVLLKPFEVLILQGRVGR